MNEELINSLMWKAGAKFEMMNWVHYDDFDYRKFAELIVEECNKASADEIMRLRAALKECADDLECEIMHRYGDTVHKYQSQRLKRDQDMTVVIKARDLLLGEKK